MKTLFGITRQFICMFLLVTASILSLSSCGDYGNSDSDNTQKVSVSFSFSSDNGVGGGSTKAASGEHDPADFTVYKLDFFAIASSSGIITGKTSVDLGSMGELLSEGISKTVNITVPQGNVEYVVIANATDASDRTKLTAAVTKNQLLSFISDKTPTDPKLLMSQITDPINTTATGQVIPVVLVRAISRIQLFLDKKNIPDEVKITKITVKNGAQKSYFLPSTTPTGSTSDLISVVSGGIILEENGTTPEGEFIHEIPVYENFDGSKPTYLILEGTYAGIPTTYKVYLNDANAPSPIVNIERNTIYRVCGTITGQGDFQGIQVKINVLPWNEKNLNIDVSQTRIEVGKTVEELSYQDVIPVTTNTLLYTASADDQWLTVEIVAGGVKITADRATYPGTPRTTKLRITANNVTKVIEVTQRPDVGTISAPASFWVSPTSGNTTRTITITSKGAWVLITPEPATVTPDVTSGTGNAAIIFTRKAHTGTVTDYTPYYGNSVFTLMNTETLETTIITATNLYMEFTNISVGNNTGSNTVTLVAPDVLSLGSLYSVTAKPDWATTTVNADGSLIIDAQGSPDGNSRTGQITFTNNTDPTYKITTNLDQKLQARIPAFNYLVLKVTWDTSGGDVDINSYFDQTIPKFVGKKLGFDGGVGSGTNSRYYLLDSPDLITGFDGPNPSGLFYWGGDAQLGQGESIFFNAPQIDSDESLPQIIKLYMYTRLYSGTAKEATFSIYAYKLGDVTHNDCNFYFAGEVVASPLTNPAYSKTLPITPASTLKLEVLYDRKLHTATVNYLQ